MDTQTEETKRDPSEHMMEAFPSLSGMPSEWHEHDLETAKQKMAEQEKKDKIAREKAKKVTLKFETDAEKERHLMETFPSPNTDPQEWHCTTCDDEVQELGN